MCAPPICRRRWQEQRFSVPAAPTKMAAASEHRSERSEQSNTAVVRAADLQEEMAEQRFPFRQLRRRWRQPANIGASGASNQIQRDARAAAQNARTSVD